MQWKDTEDNRAMKKIIKHLQQHLHFSYVDAKLLYSYAYDYWIMLKDFGRVFPERVLGMLALPVESWDDFVNANPRGLKWHSPDQAESLSRYETEAIFDYLAEVSASRKKLPDTADLQQIIQVLIDRDGFTYEQAKLLYYCAYEYENVLEDTGRFDPGLAMIMLGMHRDDTDYDDCKFLNAGYPESEISKKNPKSTFRSEAMTKQTFVQLVQTILNSTPRYKMQEIRNYRLVTVKALKPIFDPVALEKLLIRQGTFGSMLELQAVLNAARAGIPGDFFMCDYPRRPELFKANLVKKLYGEYGMRKDLAVWAVDKWAAAFGWNTDEAGEKMDIADFHQPPREFSYTTELVSAKDIPAYFSDKGKKLDMPPVHLSRDYVTNQQWRLAFPTHIVQSGWLSQPVTWVTSLQSKEFCNLLSIRDGLKPCYNFYSNKCTFDTTANGWRLPNSVESIFLYYAWGRDDDYLRLARNAI